MKNLKKINNFISEDWNRRIISNSKNANRLVDYDNLLDWFEVKKALGKNKGKYWLSLSLQVGGLKLTDLGYKDKWSKTKEYNKVIEQFRVLITKKQLNELKAKLIALEETCKK